MLSSNIWRPIAAAGGVVALLALVACGLTYRWGASGWAKLATLQSQADTVVIALQTASDDPKVTWTAVPNQILALGDAKRQWQLTSERQSQAVRDMLTATRQLKARSDELKRLAEAARAKRQAAIDRLSDIAATPQEKADCAILLSEANKALDEVYREGL